MRSRYRGDLIKSAEDSHSWSKTTFDGLTLAQIRMAPNVLEILMGGATPVSPTAPASAAAAPREYDVFLAYHKHDSRMALAAGEAPDAPPSYAQLVHEGADPRRLKARLEEAGFSVWIDVEQPPDFSYADMVTAMTNSKVILACVSNAFAEADDNRMQFQFAKRNLNKPIIAAVVEAHQPGPPWNWQTSVVG